jgi:hypothetical protein
VPTIQIAHLHEQGQDIVVVPMDSSFAKKTGPQQKKIIATLQDRAIEAGLKGQVVPVWESGGRTHFIAPPPWHPFFQSLSLKHVWEKVNKEISW